MLQTCAELDSKALEEQRIEVNVPPDARTLELIKVNAGASTNSYDDTVIKGILERVSKMEKIFNYIDEDELEFMKHEILAINWTVGID